MNSPSEGAQLGFGLIDLDLRGLGVARFRGAVLRLSGLCRLSPGYSGPKDYARVVLNVLSKEGIAKKRYCGGILAETGRILQSRLSSFLLRESLGPRTESI